MIARAPTPVGSPASAPGRPQRVLHVARRFHPMLGGIERYVLEVARAQARLGHDVTVVTLDIDVLGNRPGRLPADDRVDGVRVLRLRGVGAQRYGLTVRPDRLVREIRRAGVVHLHDLRFMTGVVSAACIAMRRPLILHTHGLLYHTPFASRLKHLAMRVYYGPWLRLAGAWVAASSEPDRNALIQDIPALAPRTSCFDNALDLEPFLGIERRPEPGLVIATGRVARYKGIDDLLTALARTTATDWRLEIAGTENAEERHRLDLVVTQLGIGERVRFTGEYTDDDHLDRLARASVAAFPSRAEGFGLALLEALASGVPVVARDQPAHRSVVGTDLTGLLVDFSDHEAAAEALSRALERPADESERIGMEERRRAGVFGLPRLIGQIEKVYASLATRT